jgi:mxaJ protein
MCFAFHSRLGLVIAGVVKYVALLSTFAVPAGSLNARELRVCADPNNLPFSNERLEGFENKLVGIIADELQAHVSYTWWAQRRGFIRNTLKAGLCDLVPGMPAKIEMLRTTTPYYRSTYVFVTRVDGPSVVSLDDPILHKIRVGVQLIGDDGYNTPPAHALAHRGVVEHVRGFPVYGDYRQPNPPARIIEAVADGTIDVAAVWGPLAGYFAHRQKVPLAVRAISPQLDRQPYPMAFDIAIGVRREDEAFLRELEGVLKLRGAQVDALLATYGVPRLEKATAPGPGGGP